ncbi:hypothetical protein DFJ74DRAFT_120002 [Hyaloraphidium curvatum]|nr:hypothetical protein DFJ74DRAFT_120002 [Hyaloraphidium curvatum]
MGGAVGGGTRGAGGGGVRGLAAAAGPAELAVRVAPAPLARGPVVAPVVVVVLLLVLVLLVRLLLRLGRRRRGGRLGVERARRRHHRRAVPGSRAQRRQRARLHRRGGHVRGDPARGREQRGARERAQVHAGGFRGEGAEVHGLRRAAGRAAVRTRAAAAGRVEIHRRDVGRRVLLLPPRKRPRAQGPARQRALVLERLRRLRCGDGERHGLPLRLCCRALRGRLRGAGRRDQAQLLPLLQLRLDLLAHGGVHGHVVPRLRCRRGAGGGEVGEGHAPQRRRRARREGETARAQLVQTRRRRLHLHRGDRRAGRGGGHAGEGPAGEVAGLHKDARVAAAPGLLPAELLRVLLHGRVDRLQAGQRALQIWACGCCRWAETCGNDGVRCTAPGWAMARPSPDADCRPPERLSQKPPAVHCGPDATGGVELGSMFAMVTWAACCWPAVPLPWLSAADPGVDDPPRFASERKREMSERWSRLRKSFGMGDGLLSPRNSPCEPPAASCCPVWCCACCLPRSAKANGLSGPESGPPRPRYGPHDPAESMSLSFPARNCASVCGGPFSRGGSSVPRSARACGSSMRVTEPSGSDGRSGRSMWNEVGLRDGRKLSRGGGGAMSGRNFMGRGGRRTGGRGGPRAAGSRRPRAAGGRHRRPQRRPGAALHAGPLCCLSAAPALLLRRGRGCAQVAVRWARGGPRACAGLLPSSLSKRHAPPRRRALAPADCGEEAAAQTRAGGRRLLGRWLSGCWSRAARHREKGAPDHRHPPRPNRFPLHQSSLGSARSPARPALQPGLGRLEQVAHARPFRVLRLGLGQLGLHRTSAHSDQQAESGASHLAPVLVRLEVRPQPAQPDVGVQLPLARAPPPPRPRRPRRPIRRLARISFLLPRRRRPLHFHRTGHGGDRPLHSRPPQLERQPPPGETGTTVTLGTLGTPLSPSTSLRTGAAESE